MHLPKYQYVKQSVCLLEPFLQRHLLTDDHKQGLNSSSCQCTLPPDFSPLPSGIHMLPSIPSPLCANLGVYFAGHHSPNKIFPLFTDAFVISGWHILTFPPQPHVIFLGLRSSISSVRPSLISPPRIKCCFWDPWVFCWFLSCCTRFTLTYIIVL